MNILITNDDGITSEGIVKLAKAAKDFGKVWVVAPDGQRSAMSHRITYFDEIEAEEYDFPVEDVKAFSCSGTPADCVRVGALKLVGQKPDFVFSGINFGYNIAGDIQYSGTAAAALEASFWNIPAIAFSRDATETSEVADEYLSQIISEYIKKPLGKNQIWNVNFPGCSLKECKGILHDRTVSEDCFYEDEYSEKIENGKHILRVIGKRNWNGSEGTDLEAVFNNYISIGKVQNVK